MSGELPAGDTATQRLDADAGAVGGGGEGLVGAASTETGALQEPTAMPSWHVSGTPGR